MSQHYHALVWIDHHQAKVFQFDTMSSDHTVIHSTHPHEHLHHHANAGDSGRAPVDHGFLERVAQAILHSGAILITGPGSAKQELATHISRVHPQLAKAISAVQTSDHPTDGELLASGREFFRADDRMHSQVTRRHT
jgi:stalled ribosome rescue protein Dom34